MKDGAVVRGGGTQMSPIRQVRHAGLDKVNPIPRSWIAGSSPARTDGASITPFGSDTDFSSSLPAIGRNPFCASGISPRARSTCGIFACPN